MLAFVLPLLGAAGPAVAQSVVTQIVSDPLTGIALGGMDPVSYFTESTPVPGSADHELVWQGVSWLFATAANRDVFERHPAVYAPQFGGHCGMSMARGFVADSDATLYAVFKQRLYLFYSAANREAFLLAPDRAGLQAEVHWQTLSKTLSTQ